MDIHASTVDKVKLLTQITTRCACQLQPVMETTNIKVLVMPLSAMLADHALLDYKLTHKELDAIDQDQSAIASRDTHQMVTNALTVDQDKSLIQITEVLVSLPQLVIKVANISVLVMQLIASDAELAQPYSSQPMIDQDALDQDQLATVFKDTLLMDIHAFSVDLDKLSTQETTKNVCQPHNVLLPTNISVLVMLKTVMLAEPVLKTSSQLMIEPDVMPDQDQFATASKATQPMDINASTANQDMYQMVPITNNVSQPQHVTETTNTEVSVMLKTAMLADHAQLDTLLTNKEMDASDQDQLATASKNTLLMDIHASHAH
jgi:hypothetical protein